jgi:secretion/DNA translocation related CpaE-like protein
MSSESLRPLLVTADPGLTDAVLAVASEAGVDLSVTPDPGSAAPFWASAPLVLIDSEQLSAAAALPSRRGIVIVTRAIEDAETWRRLVGAGVEHIVELPLGAPWLFERLGRSLETDPQSGLVAVVGAAGGAGTSTVAGALAHHLAVHEGNAVLVDLDPAGGGIDLMLGGEDDAGARWNELAGVSGRVDERILIDALPVTHGLPVLSWPAEGEIEPDAVAVGHVLDALMRSRHSVVADIGRGVDLRCHSALARAAQVVVVVPLRVRAVASARRLLCRLPQHVTPVLLAREPAPGGLATDDVAVALDLPIAATLSHDRRRPSVEELGGPTPDSSQWRRVCEMLLTRSAAAA